MRNFLLPIAFAGAVAAQTPTAQPNPAFSPAGEVNRELPKWLRFSGDFRTRFEGFSGGGFKPDTSDEYALTRVRLGLTIQPTSWLKFFAQGQDARAIAKSPALPPFQNTWDLRQSYVELGDPEKSLFAFRAGRQEINFGDQRLIGSSNWTNTARTFDAVRGTARYGHFHVDAFSASVVNPVDGQWDHHQQGNNIHGLYGGIEKLIPGATIEPYVFWRLQPRVKSEAGDVANVDFKVPGIRWVGTLPMNFDYGAEMAQERGKLATDRIRAWAGHWVVGHTSASVPWKPRLLVEYNYASGDKNPKDGVRGTFDQLYPTAHEKYGMADQVGWRNIKDFRLGVEAKPAKRWTVASYYHDWHLASRFDALYNASSTAIVRSVNGTAGTHVGDEFDIRAGFAITKTLLVNSGYAHIFPGEFLKEAAPGHSYNYQYVTFEYAF